MQSVGHYGDVYVLRFVRGEELMEGLAAFCEREGVKAGWVEGIGAGDHAKLSYYNITKQRYAPQHIDEEFEIASILGNVSEKEGKVFLHLHATFAKKDLTVIGGHLHSVKISGTCEMRLTKFPGLLQRSPDKDTGLWLLGSNGKNSGLAG